MLTALPYRFHFPAIGLSGFRVPQKSRTVKAPVWLFDLPGLTFHVRQSMDNQLKYHLHLRFPLVSVITVPKELRRMRLLLSACQKQKSLYPIMG
jgi:hypothetical protein